MSFLNVIFDLDGTLVDSASGILASIEMALKHTGVVPIVPLCVQLIGPPLRETLGKLAGTTNEDLLDSMCGAFMAHYDTQGYRDAKPYEGVADLIGELSGNGFQLFIVTNKRRVPTRLIIEGLGWHHHFVGAYSPDSFSPIKSTKVETLAEAMNRSRLEKCATLYVGDREEDADAANRTGISFFYADWGYGQSSQPPERGLCALRTLLARDEPSSKSR